MDQENRYSNFSSAGELLDSFRPGSGLSEDQNLIGTELYKALSYRNPTLSIQHLLAFQTATLAFQNRELLKSLRLIKLLLVLITGVVGFSAYKLLV